MRAVVITEPGEPEVMQWLDVPDPSPGPGEVVIDVAASGVNRADLMQRQGFYPPPPGAPPYPGLECSGRVRAVGEQVTSWRPGDEVCALLAGGGYAEQVAVPAGQLLPVPAHVDITTAAAFPETACTVYANVFQVAGLAAGEMLLVHGGTSGIGTMAIQLAKAFGARVACTAGTPEKLARCRELGADVAINYRTEDFVAAVQEATGGAGADVILDIMGASYLARNLAALATGGRLVIIGRQRRQPGRNRPGRLAGQAGERARHDAAGAAGPREGRCRGGRARPRMAAHRRREGRRRDRQETAHVAGGAGAPRPGGQRAHRQDLARARVTPAA